MEPMGMLLIVLLLVGVAAALAFTAGVGATYRLLDGDNRYDVKQWWRHWWIPIRSWWQYSVRRKPRSKPYDGPLPNFLAQLFEMSPLDTPLVSMLGMSSDEPYTFEAPEVGLPRYTRDQGVLERLSDMNEEDDDESDV